MAPVIMLCIVLLFTGASAADPLSLSLSGTTPIPFSPLSKPRLEKGTFLIAGEKLTDPNFAKTVVLLIDYGPHGAMGVVVNRPTAVKLSDILPDVESLKDRTDTVYVGGPVARNQMLLLVQTNRRPDRAQRIFENVFIVSPWEEVQNIIDRADTKEKFRAYAGYSGWAPGQVDQEIARGDWHIRKADAESVFVDSPEKIWQKLIRHFSNQWVEIMRKRL